MKKAPKRADRETLSDKQLEALARIQATNEAMAQAIGAMRNSEATRTNHDLDRRIWDMRIQVIQDHRILFEDRTGPRSTASPGVNDCDPPMLAEFLLTMLLRPSRVDAVTGDLREHFDIDHRPWGGAAQSGGIGDEQSSRCGRCCDVQLPKP